MGAYATAKSSQFRSLVLIGPGRPLLQITHHDAEYTICTRYNGISGPPVPRWEQLGRHGIQHTVHHIAREAVSTIPSKQCIRRACRRRRKNEYASEDLK